MNWDKPSPAGASGDQIIAAHRAPRLFKNALANLLRLGTTWLIVLFVPPLLTKSLDKPAYATWMLVLQLGAYATLFDAGLQLAIGRFVAQAEKAGDRGYLGEILSSAAALLLVGAAVVLLFVAAASMSIGSLFHSIPRALIHPASLTLLVVGGSLAVAFPASALAGLSLGLERNQVNAVAGGVSKLVGAAGTVWAALHHQGLVVMGLWTAAGTLAQPLLFLLAGSSYGLRSLFRISLVRTRTLRAFARFCSAMIASQFTMLLISGLDLPIVAAYDFHDAGYYALATTASNMLLVPFGAVLTTLIPMLTGMSMGNETERMGRVLIRTTRLSTSLLALIAVPLMLGMPALMHLWVGADYARHTVLFAEILVAAQLVRLTLAPYATIAFSAGEQNRTLFSPIGESMVNLLLSLTLVHWMGAVGVALGTLIGACVGITIHFWKSMASTRSMIFSRKQLLLEGIAKPVAWAMLPALLTAGLLSLGGALALQLVLLCGSAGFLGLLFWKATLKPEDRKALRGLGSRLLPSALRTSRMEA